MSTFYTGRHRAIRTSPSAAHRAGVGVLAATALGLGATTMTATSASAQGGPTTPSSSSSASSTETTSTPSSSNVVESGDTGAAVEEVQAQVDVPVDGVFGSETEAAVMDFQSENGLTADGVVGPETSSALGSEGGSSESSSDSEGASAQASSSSEGASTQDSSSNAGASTQASSDAGSADSSVVGTAESLIGSPYTYGGTTPDGGFDCSGFVQYVYDKHGQDVPRTTQEQMAAATPVSEPQPGDIVFFGDDAYHNGIYAGDGKIIDAGNSGTGVTERDIWTDDVSYGRF